MNLLDIIIIVYICYNLYKGFKRGFIKEIASIIGSILGFFFVCTYFLKAKDFLLDNIVDIPEQILIIVGFLIIFFGLSFIISILGHLVISLFIKKGKSRSVNNILGIFIGFVKSVIIISALFIAVAFAFDNNIRLIEKSRLSPYFIKSSEIMSNIIPDNVKDIMIEKIEGVKNYW